MPVPDTDSGFWRDCAAAFFGADFDSSLIARISCKPINSMLKAIFRSSKYQIVRKEKLAA